MNHPTPLVSIIVTTRNNHDTLPACLQSIAQQSYEKIEMIVVDNHSTDDTRDIARRFTPHVYTEGPERSAQRNFGVERATGQYVAIIDSDMELSPTVVSDCVAMVTQRPQLGSIIIPEESFGEGFWAQCKRLERSFYVGVDFMEAARFFRRDLYRQLEGYDTDMVSGEDWDLSQRAGQVAPIGRIVSFIRHNEGRLNLMRTLGKKYYYAGLARDYLAKNRVESKLTAQQGPIQRYKMFLSQPGKLFRNPVLGFGVLYMKTAEFAAGALGYYRPRKQKEPAEETA